MTTIDTLKPAQKRVFDRIKAMPVGEKAFYQWRYFDGVYEAKQAGLADVEKLERSRGCCTLKVTRLPSQFAVSVDGQDYDVVGNAGAAADATRHALTHGAQRVQIKRWAN